MRKVFNVLAILFLLFSFSQAQRAGGEQKPDRPPSSGRNCGGSRQVPCPKPEPKREPTSESAPKPTQQPPLPDGAIAPYPGALPCEWHDPNIWHGVWDYEHGCYYDHHHGVDPFGTPFADYVSEWDSLYEGEKHEGYKFLYFESPYQCQLYDGFGEGCVTSFLLRIHDLGTIKHLSVRRHSNRIVAEVCDTALSKCGVIEAGLLTDYGVTHCPYKEQQCELADDPWTMEEAEQHWEQPPYRTSIPVYDEFRILEKGLNPQFWQSLGPNAIMQKHFSPMPNRNLQLAWSSPDAWGMIDPEDYASGTPSENQLGGPDFTNGLNNSRFCVINVRVIVPSGVQPGFSGFTDDYGRTNDNCEAFGPGCWTLSLSETVPDLSTFSWSFLARLDCSTTPTVDFDVCFDTAGSPMNCLYGGTSAGWLRPAHGQHDH